MHHRDPCLSRWPRAEGSPLISGEARLACMHARPAGPKNAGLPCKCDAQDHLRTCVAAPMQMALTLLLCSLSGHVREVGVFTDDVQRRRLRCGWLQTSPDARSQALNPLALLYGAHRTRGVFHPPAHCHELAHCQRNALWRSCNPSHNLSAGGNHRKLGVHSHLQQQRRATGPRNLCSSADTSTHHQGVYRS